MYCIMYIHVSGQISIIPKPELREFWGSSLIKPPFRVTSADVVIICPDVYDHSETTYTNVNFEGISYDKQPL